MGLQKRLTRALDLTGWWLSRTLETHDVPAIRGLAEGGGARAAPAAGGLPARANDVALSYRRDVAASLLLPGRGRAVPRWRPDPQGAGLLRARAQRHRQAGGRSGAALRRRLGLDGRRRAARPRRLDRAGGLRAVRARLAGSGPSRRGSASRSPEARVPDLSVRAER